ncbi:hypothetical protein OESDEN_06027 [Oesophagostomum dentatum]|uniref:Uncharacterized protein n=1 Tax=Oesophagostomum dentatum TaxID=61180 RepID=A0A0B1T9Y1_OESDE|nr:hypothetical protein OESDEN_06027 [Oesophagostomum dentatum]
MSNEAHPKISDEDLGKVMGISRYLNLSFTEPQIRAIIEAIEAGANPTSLFDWIRQVEVLRSENAAEARPAPGR